MTETHDPDPIDLEHRLDRTLAKYLDEKLHRWSHLDAGADRGDLASDLATAARAHFTSGAITTLNENRGADPRVRICTGAAQLAEWATALLDNDLGLPTSVTFAGEVGRELIAEVHGALGALWAVGYAAMGEPSVVDGFRLRDLLTVIDTVASGPYIDGTPEFHGALAQLLDVRRGFVDQVAAEAPDVGLVALRPGERIVSTYAPVAPAGLARKVGRLLDDAAAPDGWIIVRPGHDFEALVERIVDTVREAMPVPDLPPARALNPESPVFCLTEALLALDTAASARTASAATGLLQTARQRILDGIRALPEGAPDATTDDDPRADPPLWATANAAMVELFRAVRCCPVEDLARLDQSKVLDARRAVEWVENMPPVLWPASTFEEEPF